MNVRLIGGLGNQLFQISAARMVSRAPRLQVSGVSFDSSICDARPRNSTKLLRKRLILDTQEVWTGGATSGWWQNLTLARRAKSGWVQHLPAGKLRSHERCSEAQFLAGDCDRILTSDTHIGFFQSSKALLDFIMKERPIKLAPGFKIPEACSYNPSTSAVLHLRRGDYLKSGHGILGSRYYAKALEQISAANVVLISDDAALGEEMVRELGDPRVKFLRTHQLTNVELLLFLASFKEIVAANSTLSWWAGALSGPESTMYAPSPWGPKPKNELALPGVSWKLLAADWALNSGV